MLRVFWAEQLVCGINMALEGDLHGVRARAHWWLTEGLELIYDAHRTPNVGVMALFKRECKRIVATAEYRVLGLSQRQLRKLVHCMTTLKLAFMHKYSCARSVHRQVSFFDAEEECPAQVHCRQLGGSRSSV